MYIIVKIVIGTQKFKKEIRNIHKIIKKIKIIWIVKFIKRIKITL
jgi:hypothetical protein